MPIGEPEIRCQEVQSLLKNSLCSAIVIALAFGCCATTLAQQTSGHESARIQGSVRDASGKPVSEVLISLRPDGDSRRLQSTTNEAGEFEFSGLPVGSYAITVEKAGFLAVAQDSIRLSPAEKKRCEFVLQSSSSARSTGAAAEFQFDDQPHFKIAGITDSAGSGGHAAETRLRTGEVLAKDTLNLKGRAEASKEASQAGIGGNETALRAQLSQNPRSFSANRQLGEMYLQSQRYGEAIRFLSAAYDIDPRNHQNAVGLLEALTDSGEVGEARDRATRMLAEDKLSLSEQADFHRLLGEGYEKSSDPLSAVREYENAAGMDRSEQNYFAWGSELLLHRAAAPAIEVFSKGSRLHPHSARMLAGLGAALFTSGSIEDGAERLCQASDLDPKNPAPFLFLGKMQEGTSSPLSCAEQKLARFAHDQPENALADYYYGLAVWRRSRGTADAKSLAQAGDLFEKAANIDPKLDVAFLELGNLEFARAEFPQAIASYQKAVAINPDGSEAHYRLGLAYKRAGEESRAKTEFDSFKKLDKSETEKIEQQRHDVRQFLFVLQDQPASQ